MLPGKCLPHCGGRNRSHDFLRALDSCGIFRGKAERARRGGQQGGQLVELLVVFLFSYPEFHIQLVARLQGQVKTRGGGQFLGFFGGNPYFHRGTFVKFDVMETALRGIADVKIQFFHHFLISVRDCRISTSLSKLLMEE